jgi:hypothetical protein
MLHRCRICGKSTVHISHFRLFDVLRLILLQLPVRCRTCRRRYYVSISQANVIRNESHTRKHHSDSANSSGAKKKNGGH